MLHIMNNKKIHNIYEAANVNFSCLRLQVHFFFSNRKFPLCWYQIPCIFSVWENGLPNSLFSLCLKNSCRVLISFLILDIT